MRVIIAGGSGYLGGLLSTDLTSAGHEVIILSRDPARHQRLSQPGIQIVQWDGKTASGWGHLVEGAHAIVILTGVDLSTGRWTKQMKRRFLESRVLPGKAVLAAVKQAQHKPEVVVQSSGVNYYGTRGEGPVTEASPRGEDYLADLSLQWETSSSPVSEMGVRHVIFRSAVVLSKNHGALPRMLMPFRFFVGGPVGSGRQYFPWIHPADEIAALRFLIDNSSASGAYNLVAPQPLTNREFARIAGKVMHRPALIPVPAFVLKLLFGEMSVVVLEGLPVLPQRLQEAGFSFRFPAFEPALRDVLS